MSKIFHAELRQLIFEAAYEIPLNLTVSEIRHLAHEVAVRAEQRGCVDTNLPPRLLDMLRAMAAGETRGETAKRLYLSEDTVRSHRRRLFQRLGARTSAQAVAIAFHRGLLGPAAAPARAGVVKGGRS